MTTIRFDSLRALRAVNDVREVESVLCAQARSRQVIARWGNAPAWLLEKPSDMRLLSRYGLPAGAQLPALSLIDGPGSPADDAQFGQPLGQPRDALPTTHPGEGQMPAGGLAIASLSMPALLQCLTPLLCRYAPAAMDRFNNLPDGFEDVDAGLAVLTKDLQKHFGLCYWTGTTSNPSNGFYAQITVGYLSSVFHAHYFEGKTQPEAIMRAVLAALLSTPTHKAAHVWMAPDKPSFLEAVKRDGMVFANVPKPVRTQALLVTAIRQLASTGGYAPNAWCFEAVKNDGLAIRHIRRAQRTAALSMEAVKQNGLALQYVPEELRSRELCDVAIASNGEAAAFVPEKLPDQVQTFQVNVTFTFSATVEVLCSSAEEAKAIINNSFGCVSPSYHANDDSITSWDAEVHPDKKVAWVKSGFDSGDETAPSPTM